MVVPIVCATTLLSEPTTTAFGLNHTPDVNNVVPEAETYRVNIRNLTTDVFDQIVVFYKRVGKPGVVFLKEVNVKAGEFRGFVLGPCPEMESYVIGFFQGDNMVAQLPSPAREAESQGRGMGHLTLWCGTCSAEDHRDTRFYEPPHQVKYSGPVSGWMTQPDALVRRRRRPGRRRLPRAGLRPRR